MKIILFFLILLLNSKIGLSQEFIENNLKGVKDLSVKVSHHGDLKMNFEDGMQTRIESMLLDENIKLSDDYNNSRYKLSLSVISKEDKDGYTFFISFDLHELVFIKRLNKDFYCRTYGSLNIGYLYYGDVSYEIIKNLASNLVTEFIHQYRKSNQK